jgi:hypothetical protein
MKWAFVTSRRRNFVDPEIYGFGISEDGFGLIVTCDESASIIVRITYFKKTKSFHPLKRNQNRRFLNDYSPPYLSC